VSQVVHVAVGTPEVHVVGSGQVTTVHVLAAASAGPAGDPGTFDWQGAWSALTGYVVDQAVSYLGSSYVAIQDGTNQNPATETAYWELIAAKGDTGAQGIQGDPGEGVPVGGTAGQVLTKDSGTDYDTSWQDAAETGAPDDADYLVGTATAGLSNEIAVGTTPGGELGGTWASPTVDATHSGSTHAAVQAAAEATAAAALLAHTTDAADAHDASAISILDAAGDFTATDVEGALAELQSDAETDAAALATHLADSDAHEAWEINYDTTGNTYLTTGSSVNAALADAEDEFGTLHTEIDDHLADATAAHAASAISVTPTGALTSTDAQAGFAEIDSDIQFVGALHTAHLGDTTDAHDASAISIADAGTYYTGTDVEAALQEIGAGGIGGGGAVPSFAWAYPFPDTYLTPWQTVSNAVGAGSGALYFLPVTPILDCTLDEIGVNVSVDQAGGQVRVGIYDSDPDTLYPTDLLVDGGAIACTSTGELTNAISFSMTAGHLYWLACLGEPTGTQATMTITGTGGNIPGAPQNNIQPSTLWACTLLKSGVATGSMPDPAPSGATWWRNSPVIGAHVVSVP
jgi:hypothetical protein